MIDQGYVLLDNGTITQLTADVPIHWWRPGDVINGRYLIERELGHGGAGVVYSARDMARGDCRVALKSLHQMGLSEEQMTLLSNEFRVMVDLSHPNLAASYDFEPIQGTNEYCLTMEYVDGTTLDRYVEPWDWREALNITVQVCRALAYMHSRGFTHFDLKPANIMITEGQVVKVLDFGLAGARAVQAEAGQVIGSPYYMSPEMVVAAGTADHRADIYSLGIVLYQMLTGRIPFRGDSLLDVLKSQCRDPLVFDQEGRARVPAWLRRVVERMCAKEPADRYRSANAVIETINKEGGLRYEVETRQTRESYVLSSRFVARQQEKAAVLEFVCASLGKTPPAEVALFVAGVSGIGKSRLMREVRHALQLDGRRFIETNCYEGALSEFAPIAEAVRLAVGIAAMRGATDVLLQHAGELARLDPVLAREKGWEPSPSTDNAETDRQRMMLHVTEFMLEVAALEPYALYVNDLQWALRGTADMLELLMRRLALRRSSGHAPALCLLGSYREEEVTGRPLARVLEEGRKLGLREISLDPLTKKDVGDLVGSMLGIEAPPEGFIVKVYEESGGNPYFVEEIMRTLVENGTVYLKGGQWVTAADTQRLDVPDTVTGALMRRCSTLDATSRRLLDLMAVHAKPLSMKALEVAGGMGAPDLHRSLGILVKRRMAVRDILGEEMTYRVVHDRLREALVDALPETRRREMHGALARGFRRAYAGNEEAVVYELARHYWEAGDKAAACEYSLKAAEKAYREYANEFGILLYRRALELLPRNENKSLRLDILEKLGEMCFLTGRYEEAMAHYSEVLASTEDPLLRSRLLRKQAEVCRDRGQLREATDKLWQGVSLLGGDRLRDNTDAVRLLIKHSLIRFARGLMPFFIRPARDTQERARLEELVAIYVRLGHVLVFLSPIQAVLVVLMSANLAERLGESRQLCLAYGVLGWVYGIAKLGRHADHYGERAIDMAQRLNMTWLCGDALNFRGLALYYGCRWDEALVKLRRAKSIIRNCGDFFELAISYVHISYCLLMQGQYETALQSSEEGLLAVRETGAWQLGKSVWIHAQMAKAKLGRFEGVREEMAGAIRMCDEAGDVLSSMAHRVFYGDALLMSGDTDGALAQWEEALIIKEKHKLLEDYGGGVYAYLVRAYWEQWRAHADSSGQPPSKVLRSRLRRLSRKAVFVARLACPNYLSPAWVARGISHWMDGRTRAACRCFRKGIEIARFQGAGMWLAEGCYEAGRCLILSPQTRSEGIRYLEQAEELFAKQGCRPYLERTRELLRTI